ncbi:MAG: efflux RND transporter permease subunit [bacterium]
MTLGDLVSGNRTAILGITALLAAAGGVAAWTMPVSIFPEVAFHRVSLIARAGHLPVEQTVTSLTQPLENVMTAVPGIETIRSMTTRGGTQLDLVFAWGSDMAGALQAVLGATEQARADLPAGTEFEARPLDTSAFPIIGIAVSSTQRSLGELSDFVLYEAAPQLRTLPGVYRVDLEGAKTREYALVLDPSALAAYRLTPSAIETALRDANIVAAGGLVADGHQLILAVVRGPGTEPQHLLDIVVAQQGGTSVPLRAVAQLTPSLREDFTRASANGDRAVLLGISRQPDGNAVSIDTAVRDRLAALERAHPEYHFAIFYNQADLVHEAIASVRDSIGIGLVLAVATLYFFIADRRATAVAAAVIPASVLITCVALRGLGMSFNLMTLGGIAAGIGLILDDAIVVIENVYRHRAGGARGAAALRASLGEITHALLGSTLTPVAVLLPLGVLGGVPGAFFRPLALTMSIALLVSLVLALTFTPALAMTVEPRSAAATGGPGDRLAAVLSTGYGRGLGWALRHRWFTSMIGVAMLLVALTALQHVETGFVPVMDEGAFVLDYWAPPGASLDETERMLTQVDAALQATPEVEGFSRRTGAELGFFLTEPNRGDYAVRLHGGARRAAETVIEDVRQRLESQVPGLRVEFVQVLQDMIGDLSGNPSPIELKFFGDDPTAVRATAVEAARRIAAVPGIVDAFDGIIEVGPTYDVNVDTRRAALVGLDTAVVQHWVETAVTGTVVGQVLERDRAVPLRLGYPERFRDHLDALAGLTLVTPDGGVTPLDGIARLTNGSPSVQREREDLRPLVRVTAHLEGRDLGSGMAAIRHALADLALPTGVSLVYGGLYASQQQAFTELLVVFGASLACVSALLLIEFGSLAAVIAIVLGSSLALSGSLVALWLTGTALNVSSIVGMIMVVGIVAKNGILLLDFAGQAYARTGDLSAALIDAGRVRLRPILMTSLAAMAGLAPLALAIGAGAEMQQPLAIAIIGGVSISMLCSLIGVPLLYVMLARPPRPAETVDAPAGS